MNMCDADVSFESDIAADMNDYDDDDYDQYDDGQTNSDEDDDLEEDDEGESKTTPHQPSQWKGEGELESDGDGSSVVANASPEEQDAHRSMLGVAMQRLCDKGIDEDQLAEDSRIDSSDVNSLSHDDLATLTQFIAYNYPEVLQRASDEFPAAHRILDALTGDQVEGGFFGRLFGDSH